MSSNNKKSAKDIAFNKERAKYNKRIRELESQLEEKDKTINSQKEDLARMEQLEDWVNRLLEYTELSEDDMKNIVNKEKATAKIINDFGSIAKMFGRVGLY